MTVTAVPLQPVKRSHLAWLWIAIAVLAAAAFLLARQGDDFWTRSLRDSDIKTTPSGLMYKVLTPGTGAHPTNTDVALIGYEGRLRNGHTFDKQKQTAMPVAGVVPGFSEALKLMNQGAKFRIWIPAKLGYGAEDQRDRQGNLVIPGNSSLVFDVDMVAFISQQQYQQFMMQQQMMGGGGPGGPPGGAPGEQGPPPGQ